MWQKHFENPPKETKKFYTIAKSKQLGEQLIPLKLVSPTEQLVDQAKSNLKRERDGDECGSTYKRQKRVKPAKKKSKPNPKKKQKRTVSKSSAYK